jgi:RNA polymerase sigma-70 factor (ECF subfamily)
VQADANLFRHESARLTAALTRIFGVANLAIVEDVVQETLTSAFEAWSYGDIPKHYSALLMTAAKNRALDVFRRRRTARKFASELGRFVESEWTLQPSIEEPILSSAIEDDQLQMMCTCCNPRLHEDVQVALVLNILCGFGVGEIASAFLATPAAIQKRLSRGKKALADSKHLFELTADDFAARLAAVHRALYLLFNEGYHGASPDAVVREDLCREALRLVLLLVHYAPSATPATHALAALMYLDAARLPSRLDEAGHLRALVEQDRTRWDATFIAEGLRLLEQSAKGSEVTVFHVEAGIAARHAAAASVDETKWEEIVSLYDVLMKINPSPVVALNRAMAIGHRDGPDSGLTAIAAIEEVERLARYPFYYAALGELEFRAGRAEAAGEHFRAAHRLARNEAERQFLKLRIVECERRHSA